jgi:hypothetical protein
MAPPGHGGAMVAVAVMTMITMAHHGRPWSRHLNFGGRQVKIVVGPL